nr:ribonuclease H-like domain, reverse transcriptase, RNA-dependent DNA polymerase [Tanacetum cinerariifolium]
TSRPVSAGRPTGSAGRPASIRNPTGSAVRPVSAGRLSGSVARTPIPAGRILGKLPSNTPSERFPRASSVENSNIHDGLKIFDCPKSGIFTSSSYDEEFSGPDANNLASSIDVSSTITKRIHNIHPTSQIIGDINSPVQTRSQVKHKGSSDNAFISYIYDQRRNNHHDFQLCMFSCFLSQEEPTTVVQALADPDWVEAMQAEMQQFKNQKVWVLVTLPNRKWAIGTKWILKNKTDGRGIVCRNKAWLVAQGHRQEEGIDYTDVFALVARFEAIRLFLAFVSFIGFMVYQMDVKSAFLYGKIAVEVYVTQPRDNSKRTSTSFEPQKIKEKNVPDEPIIVHLYRSMIGCLMYLTATRPDIMFAVCAAARHQVTPKTSHLVSVKRIFKYLTAYLKLGLWYPQDSPFDLKAFSDSDYAGTHGDRKSTTGGCTMDSKPIARL